MPLKLACAAGALLLLLLGAAWWLEGEGRSAAALAVEEAGLSSPAAGEGTDPLLERSALPPADENPESGPEELPQMIGPNPRPVSGRVFCQGETVADARVEIRQLDDELVLTTDATGLFQAELDPAARAIVRVFSGDAAACVEVRRWPVRIELEARRTLPNRVIVRDALRGVPVPEARVRVFRCLRGTSGQYGAAEGGAVVVTEGVTDAEGSLAFGFDPGFYFFEVLAPGFFSYYSEAAAEGEGEWGLEVYPGQDPDLFILDEEGNPMQGCTALLGAPAYRRMEVEASGRVTGPIGFNQPPEDGELPFILLVQLPGDRFWRANDKDANQRSIIWSPGRVECRIRDPEVQAILEPCLLPPGSWVEAARANARRDDHELLEIELLEPDVIGTPSFLGGPWHRLVPDEWTALEHGWTGGGIVVLARLQPQGVRLGTFPIEDGRARIRFPQLARLRLEVTDLPDFSGSSGWALSGFEGPDPLRGRQPAAAGSVRSSVSSTGHFEQWASPGSYWPTLVHQEWGLELLWDGRAFRDGTSWHERSEEMMLHEGENLIQAAAILGPLRAVEVLVDGHPVLGGQIGSSRIDVQGRAMLAPAPDGSLRLANPVRLILPPQLGLQPDAPVHAVDFLGLQPSASWRVDAQGALDFRLSAFLIDPRGLELGMHHYSLWIKDLSEGEIAAAEPRERFGMQFADSRGNARSRPIVLEPGSSPATYRLPEGRYMVWLRWTETQDGRKGFRHCDLTPLSGRHFPAGTQTVLSRQD